MLKQTHWGLCPCFAGDRQGVLCNSAHKIVVCSHPTALPGIDSLCLCRISVSSSSSSQGHLSVPPLWVSLEPCSRPRQRFLGCSGSPDPALLTLQLPAALFPASHC